MPTFPIIDTHLHVWDQRRLRYSAFEGSPLFGHPYHVEDYRRDCGDLEVEAMVFLECYADFWEGGGQYIEEIEFVEDEAAARSAHPPHRRDGAARMGQRRRADPRRDARPPSAASAASAASWSSTPTRARSR